MTNHKFGLRVGALFLLGILGTGLSCSSPPTSLLLTVRTGDGVPMPQKVSIWVFNTRGIHKVRNDKGVEMDSSRYAVDASSGSKVGTFVIYPPGGDLSLRVRVVGDGQASEGTIQGDMKKDVQVEESLILFRGRLKDTDGDGVPDIIDNCPSKANSDQKNSDGLGAGDECSAGASPPDAGVARG